MRRSLPIPGLPIPGLSASGFMTLGFIAVGLLALPGCLGPRPDPQPPARPVTRPAGTQIVIAGERIDIGTPVVLWTQYPGYDATRPVTVPAQDGKPASTSLAYQPGRLRNGEVLVEPESTNREQLAEVVDQFVLHYDVCGLSRTCFRVLNDRKLSVHFLLDIDGTLYQTMDLRDQAFHATKSNPRSIGVEIAQMGAYAPGKPSALDVWYAKDADGEYIRLPERVGDGGVRTVGFVGRPARKGRISGAIHGEALEQYDFTNEQYEALARLSAGLSMQFPKLKLDCPRDDSGAVLDRVLSDEEFSAFCGILGHFHVQRNKTDPGPAFDWERLMARARHWRVSQEP